MQLKVNPSVSSQMFMKKRKRKRNEQSLLVSPQLKRKRYNTFFLLLVTVT